MSDKHYTNAQTPLEIFIDTLQTQELPLLTEKGAESERRKVHIGSAFLPAVILSGNWYDWTDGPVAEATTAIAADLKARDEVSDTDNLHTYDIDAHYTMGLLVGLALAHALRGAQRPE